MYEAHSFQKYRAACTVGSMRVGPIERGLVCFCLYFRRNTCNITELNSTDGVSECALIDALTFVS